MRPYDITETLTRTLALERLKELSRQYLKAKERKDDGLMFAINRERQELQSHFFKVVK